MKGKLEIMNLFEICKNFLFPFGELFKVSKAIDKKIDKLNQSSLENPYTYEYACNDEKIHEGDLKDVLKETIENKKILEDKAKSSLIAITISSSFIFSIVKFIQDSTNQSFWIAITLAIVSFLSIVYMVAAGILSLYSISTINKISNLYPVDFLLKGKEKNQQIADTIEYNYLNNLKRNNFMSTSYTCMITSISFMLIVFTIFTCVALQGKPKKDELQKINAELVNAQNDIALLNKANMACKQDIIKVQQNLISQMDSIDNSEKKLKFLSESIEKINSIILKNPNIYSDELKQVLSDLENKLKK